LACSYATGIFVASDIRKIHGPIAAGDGIFADANPKKLQIRPNFEAAHRAASRIYLQQPIVKIGDS
jgi:hypothetical protein